MTHHFLFNPKMDLVAAATASETSTMDKDAKLRFFKAKRTTNKRLFTLTQKKLRTILEKEIQGDSDVTSAKKLMSELANILTEIRKSQDGVLLHCEEDDMDAEAGSLDEVVTAFLDLQETVEDLLSAQRKANSQAKPEPRPSGSQRAGRTWNEEEIKLSDEDDDDEDFDDAEDDTPIFKPGKKGKRPELSSEQQFFALMSMNYKAKNEVPKFDGSDVSRYPSFRQAWETADGKLEYMGKTPAEKLMELKKCLSGKALSYIENLTDSKDENYRGALRMLDKYYYDNQLTGRSAMDKLLDLATMTSDPDSMEDIYFKLTNIDQILRGLNLTSAQCRTLMFTTIAERKTELLHKEGMGTKVQR